MTITSKREVARILRAEAQSLRRHGFTNFFSHQFACVMAQVVRPERCEGCILKDFLPPEYREEAYPCQHVDEAGWMHVAEIPGMVDKVAQRFEAMAEELEAAAGIEEAHEGPTPVRT